jgi:hypothetical protein
MLNDREERGTGATSRTEAQRRRRRQDKPALHRGESSGSTRLRREQGNRAGCFTAVSTEKDREYSWVLRIPSVQGTGSSSPPDTLFRPQPSDIEWHKNVYQIEILHI